MIVKDLYLDSLLYEESSLAHYIHHLLSEQKVTLEDNVSELDLNKANHQKVAEMIQSNVLGFHKIRIYSLKMTQQEFIFIFAGSPQEATQFYCEIYHQTPLNCYEYSLDFELARGNEVISFREMRKEYMEFPAVAGYYRRDNVPGT